MTDQRQPEEHGCTPTESLVLEVLAARYRTGENYWTFDTNVGPALRRLERAGLIVSLGSAQPGTEQVRLTDAGKKAALLEDYLTPNDQAPGKVDRMWRLYAAAVDDNTIPKALILNDMATILRGGDDDELLVPYLQKEKGR